MITLLGNDAVKLIVPQYVPPAPSQLIYGVKLDRTLNNNAPLGASWATYTDDAVGFNGAYMDFANDVFVDNGWYNRWPFNQIKPCFMSPQNTVIGYLKPDDYTKYVDGTTAPITDRTQGNVMIEIPKIYYKISADSQYNYIQISDQPFTGSSCRAHTYKGQVLSKVYVDAYLSGDRNYATYGPSSISGLEPVPANFSLGYNSMYPEIKEHRGSRSEPFTYDLFTLIGCLFAIMFKTTNARTSLGSGLEKYNINQVMTGVTNNKGMCYGQPNWDSNYPATKGRIKLFGMEDYYGAKYTYCTGLYIDPNNYYRIIDPMDSTLNYSPDGFAYYPQISVATSDFPSPRNTKLVPIKVTGDPRLGFARMNQDIDANTVSSDSNVGFCSTTRYAETASYYTGNMAMGFDTDAGVYSFNTYYLGNTTRRAFRIVYFPEENNN